MSHIIQQHGQFCKFIITSDEQILTRQEILFSCVAWPVLKRKNVVEQSVNAPCSALKLLSFALLFKCSAFQVQCFWIAQLVLCSWMAGSAYIFPLVIHFLRQTASSLPTIAKYSTLFAFASVFIFFMQMKNHTENKTYLHTICTNCMNWAAASDIFEDANVPLWLLLNCLQPRRATGQKETVEMCGREFCYSKCPNECG